MSVFWADDGLDTGPILLQDECDVKPDDTVDTLYKRFLYPAGVSAMARAVDLVADNRAPCLPQGEKGATYDPMLNKPDLQKIPWSKSGSEIHDFIRGMDSVPGASCSVKVGNDWEEILVFGSSLWKGEGKKTLKIALCDTLISGERPKGRPVEVLQAPAGVIHEEGLLLTGFDGVAVNVKRVKVKGRMKMASLLDQAADQVTVEYTNEEKEQLDLVKGIWESILGLDVDEATDFFASGAGSMDVVRLVEEVKELMKLEEGLENEDVFMAPVFDEFCSRLIVKTRGGGAAKEVVYRAVELETNGMRVRFPCQLFIDGQFVDAENGKSLEIVNPSDESVVCEVSFFL